MKAIHVWMQARPWEMTPACPATCTGTPAQQAAPWQASGAAWDTSAPTQAGVQAVLAGCGAGATGLRPAAARRAVGQRQRQRQRSRDSCATARLRAGAVSRTNGAVDSWRRSVTSHLPGLLLGPGRAPTGTVRRPLGEQHELQAGRRRPAAGPAHCQGRGGAPRRPAGRAGHGPPPPRWWAALCGRPATECGCSTEASCAQVLRVACWRAGPEVACNILDEAATTSAEALEARVRGLAEQGGAQLVSAYRIGLPLHELGARAEAALLP